MNLMNELKISAQAEQIKLINQGRKAFKAGKSEDSNPYKTGSVMSKYWNAGFIEAMTESL